MTTPLTICTWLWHQDRCRTRYDASHVNAWARMVSANLTRPHRLVCFTDKPSGIDSAVDCRPLPDFPIVSTRWTRRSNMPVCYRRLSMFRRDAGEWIGERFVSMDLDLIVLGALDPMFDRDEDLMIAPGTGGGRPYNGSMLMMDAGARPAVYETFTEERAQKASRLHLGSDQGWLAYTLGNREATWRRHDGLAYHVVAGGERHRRQTGRPAYSDARVLFFPGSVKPWDASVSAELRDRYEAYRT